MHVLSAQKNHLIKPVLLSTVKPVKNNIQKYTKPKELNDKC